MSWETASLGDVCSIVNGGTPKSEIFEYWGGNLNWLTPKEMGKLKIREIESTERKITSLGLQNSSAKLLPINSVILSSRAPIGHLAINKDLMATNQGCKGLVPTNKLHYEYLYYFLSHSKKLLNDLGSGATFKELSGSKLATVQIPLPSIHIQQKIVTKLDAIFTEIDKASAVAEANIKNAEALFQSYLTEVFSKLYKFNNKAKLSTLCKFENGDRGKNYPSKAFQVNLGIPFINAGDLTHDWRVSTLGMAYITVERYQLLGAGKVKKGDVLFCLRGSLGKCGIVEDFERGAIASSLVIIRPLIEKSLSRYVYWFLSSSICTQLINESKGGTAQPNLSAKSVMNYEIPYIDCKEQAEIIKKIDEFYSYSAKLKDGYILKIKHLTALKQSILQQAFNGELIKE